MGMVVGVCKRMSDCVMVAIVNIKKLICGDGNGWILEVSGVGTNAMNHNIS